MKEYLGLIGTGFFGAVAAAVAWISWRSTVTAEMGAMRGQLAKLEAEAKAKSERDHLTFQEIRKELNEARNELGVTMSRVDGLDQATKVRELLETHQATLTRIEHKLER